jgi:hypothetical protein
MNKFRWCLGSTGLGAYLEKSIQHRKLSGGHIQIQQNPFEDLRYFDQPELYTNSVFRAQQRTSLRCVFRRVGRNDGRR